MPSKLARRFFLTPPTHFRIEYVLNQWMDMDNQVDHERAVTQWQRVLDTYRKLGADVTVAEFEHTLPDMVFLGDSILLYGQQGIASRFRHPQRTAEIEPSTRYFEAQGYRIHYPPEGVNFEGNGDTVKWNRRLLGGYGQRSDKAAHDYLRQVLDVEVVSLEVQSPHFHVDTCVCPLSDDVLAYVPDGLSLESVQSLKTLPAELIPISKEEGLLLAGNCITVDDHVVLSTNKADGFMRDLEKAGFTPQPIDLSEFAKSGGGAKCLTLEAYPAA